MFIPILGADAAKAVVVIHGIVSGVPVPFPLDDTDGCKNKGIACPIKSGSDYKYHQMLPVEAEYPQVRFQ